MGLYSFTPLGKSRGCSQTTSPPPVPIASFSQLYFATVWGLTTRTAQKRYAQNDTYVPVLSIFNFCCK